MALVDRPTHRFEAISNQKPIGTYKPAAPRRQPQTSGPASERLFLNKLPAFIVWGFF